MDAIGNSSLGNFRVLANAGAAVRSDEMAMNVKIDLIIVRSKEQPPYRAPRFVHRFIASTVLAFGFLI
jgi:hypothetical protein